MILLSGNGVERQQQSACAEEEVVVSGVRSEEPRKVRSNNSCPAFRERCHERQMSLRISARTDGEQRDPLRFRSLKQRHVEGSGFISQR